jgi:hypothetical protein
MELLNDLRQFVKSYFPESSELQLSSAFAGHRRFNFYFKIIDDCPFLLYLNWDGDYDRFTLKCLEFSSNDLLQQLIKSYTDIGSKAFNVGRPRSRVTFSYLEKNRLVNLNFDGNVHDYGHYQEMNGEQLMHCIDPFR